MARWMFVMCLLVCITEAQLNETNFYDVKDYGAIANGKTDNSGAFLKAWSNACKWDGNASIVIPDGTYMLHPVVFSGPCKGWTTFEIKGILKAPIKPSLHTTWINFRYINQLNVSGGGILNGQGASVWGRNDCKKNPNCHPLLMTMGFSFITNSYVHDLRSVDSQNAHFTMFASKNMTLTNLTISAPGNSPNTDGIKISKSQGINITSVKIGTGDDCIAMISGAKNVNISDVYCGPGHGISVGSLGKNSDEVDVEDIFVKNCTFNGTSDGLRIKTWAAPLNKTLKASNFVYEDIVINNVQRPINIDQEYCPNGNCGTKVPSKVQISNVSYKNIQGSCSGDIAVSFKCSVEKPCQNITMEDINLWRQGGKRRLRNWCSNVQGASYGNQIPAACI